jgi:uncharacterized protein YacL (UPF0231 family)
MPKPNKRIPPNMTKPCPVTRKQLAELYWVKEQTKTQIAVRFNVSHPTITKWFNQFNLKTSKRFMPMDTLEDAYQTKEGEIIWLGKENTKTANEAESETTLGDESARSAELDTLNNYRQQVFADYEEDDALLSLTPKQRDMIKLIASFEPHTLMMNDEELAALVGIEKPTLTRWRQDSTFSTCLKDAVETSFRQKMPEIFFKDLLTRYDNQLPLTKDDRALVARILGMDKLGTLNIGINFNSPLPKRY